MIRLLAVTFLVLSAQVGAQSLHVFNDGETIDAARFNDNFTALKDAINSGGSPQDGAAYGSPVWVDSSGTLLTGRDSTRVLWRVDGELKVIGQVQDAVYTSYVQRFYSTPDCTGDKIGLRSEYGYFWVSNGFINTQGALLENSPLPYNSTNFTPGGQCYVETGTIDLYQESSIGVAAPSWTMDGTGMFKDLR
ncbi:hypothetical protein N9485_05320 [Luminiphilus sp.]|nr:hypothetical protein [Luminiphilus sp.]MDB4049611.1 hypothetical protein [Luminiphilus sp.]